MKISLERLSRKIGDARVNLSKLNASLQESIKLYDAKEEERDNLANEMDALEGEPSNEQIEKLGKLSSELKELRLKNIGLADEVNKAKDALVDMEQDMKVRQASNDLDESMSSSTGRGNSNSGLIGTDGAQLGSAAGTSGRIQVLPRNQEQRRHDLGVYLSAMAIAQSHRNGTPAQIAAEFDGGEHVSAYLSNSMLASDHDRGGSWIHGEYSDMFIELLRPESIVRQMGVDEVPLEDGTMEMAKETGGPTGKYLGEDETADVEVLTTGDVKLIAKELVCIVPASDKLLRSRSAKAAERIRNSIVRGCATTEDLYFIRGAKAGAGPTGMRFLALAANILTMTATPDLQKITNDLGRMENRLMANNVRMRRAGWIMSPRTFIYLSDLRDGNGNLAFPTLTMYSGGRPMLRNKPVFVTTQVPENLGGGTESEIILADAEHLIIGDAPRIAMDSSNTAAYSDGGTIKAAFSQRKTLMRLVMENDFNTLHEAAIAVLTGVTWGV